jgi:hypothetical protein
VSGLAEITAGCISMGLGGFLAGQSEVEHYDTELKREYDEVEFVMHRYHIGTNHFWIFQK